MEIARQMFQVEAVESLSAEDKAAELKEPATRKAKNEALMANAPRLVAVGPSKHDVVPGAVQHEVVRC